MQAGTCRCALRGRAPPLRPPPSRLARAPPGALPAGVPARHVCRGPGVRGAVARALPGGAADPRHGPQRSQGEAAPPPLPLPLLVVFVRMHVCRRYARGGAWLAPRTPHARTQCCAERCGGPTHAGVCRWTPASSTFTQLSSGARTTRWALGGATPHGGMGTAAPRQPACLPIQPHAPACLPACLSASQLCKDNALGGMVMVLLAASRQSTVHRPLHSVARTAVLPSDALTPA